MDIETTGALERVHARIDALEQSLRTEIRAEAATVRLELGEEIRESLAAAKRHATVLNESVRDDIRMPAEAFAMVSTKLDSLQR